MSNKFTASLEHVLDHATGKETGGRTTSITPPKINVVSLRKKLGMSQTKFAQHYGFSVATLRGWEQGRREPEGPTRLLLRVIEQEPDAVERVVKREHEAEKA